MKHWKKLLALFLILVIAITMIPERGIVEAADNYKDKTPEYVDRFIGELLSRLGRGYSTDSGGGGHRWGVKNGTYNCTGLVSSAMQSTGLLCPYNGKDSGWDTWGKTIDWKSWF